MTTRNLSRKRETGEGGFTLLELLLVIGVGALLILAGIGIYRQVTTGNSVNEASRLVNVVKDQVQRAYQNQNDYTGLDNDDVVSMGAIPDGTPIDDSVSPADINHPFGDALEVDAVNSDANFEISLLNLPEQACMQLATLFQPNSTPDLDAFAFADDTTAGTIADPGSDGDTTVSVDDAQAGCDGGSSLSWSFF